jgi:hypothetical protein
MSRWHLNAPFRLVNAGAMSRSSTASADCRGTDGTTVQVLSRDLRDLAPRFPELVHVARALPPGTRLDGEIVISDEHDDVVR